MNFGTLPLDTPAEVLRQAQWSKSWRAYAGTRLTLRYKARRRCYYCGVPMTRDGRASMHNFMTRDHLVARSKGGNFKWIANKRATPEERNMVHACRWCNNLKRDMSVEEFRTVFAALSGTAQFYSESHVPDWSQIFA